MNHHVDPKTLTVHPAAHAVPDLILRQYAALKASIERRGIRQPLLADAENRVIDGRHRLKIALEIGLEAVPVVVVADDDAAMLACDAAVARRNLTASGRVLVLYMAHPMLARGGVRNGSLANLKKGARPPNVNKSQSGESKEFATFATLADRYGVPREYFSTLAEIEAKCGGDPTQWKAVTTAILDDEFSIPRVHAGVGSRLSTTGTKRSAPSYGVMVVRAGTTLGNAFKKWGTLKGHDVSAAVDALALPWAQMPDAVRALTVSTILRHWPAHEQADLMKELHGLGKKSGRTA